MARRRGPRLLLVPLDQLRKGLPWPPGPERPNVDLNSSRGHFKKITDWLAENDRDPEAAYQQVVAWCEKHHEQERASAFAYEVIAQACAGQQITALGIKRDIFTGKVDGEHSEIPYTYFLRPITHFNGKGPDGFGQLSQIRRTPSKISALHFRAHRHQTGLSGSSRPP